MSFLVNHRDLSTETALPAKRFFLFVSLSFFLTFWISFLSFSFHPQAYYWRAWEYFDELFFCRSYQGKLEWDGFEKGDLSRLFASHFQEKWHTHVTADAEGFRAVPFQAQDYSVLVVGDSHTWGCGLSDEETVPWKLAELANVAVFNGARTAFSLEHLLQKPSVKNAKVIVELVSFHHLNTTHFPSEFSIKKYRPLKKMKKKRASFALIDHLKIDVRRYFLPYKLFRLYSPKGHYLSLFKATAVNDYGIEESDYAFTYSDELVQRIAARAAALEKEGYTYVFAAVPPKSLICTKELPLKTLSSICEMTEKLRQKRVHALDLSALFCSQSDRKSLYFRSDLHWNAKGAELAAKAIASYLNTAQLLPDSKVSTREVSDSVR